MKKLLSVFMLVATYFAANAFVVNVVDIPEAVQKNPVSIVTGSSVVMTSIRYTLAEVKPEGSNATLQGSVQKMQTCLFKYSFEQGSGVATYYYPLFLDPTVETLELKFTDGCNRDGIQVTGSELNDKYTAIMAHVKTLKTQKEESQYIASMVAENKTNLLGVELLKKVTGDIDPNEWLDLYYELPEDLANTPSLKGYATAIKYWESHNSSGGASKKIEMFKNLKCVTADGKEVNLSDYVGTGKYVLLDFWASWCGPCRQEAKEVLMPLYEKYKDNENFEIIGIMTADEMANHVNALKTLRYPWLQLIDLGRQAGREYGFNSIPYLVLIDPQGEIIAKNIRGDEIFTNVASLFAE